MKKQKLFTALLALIMILSVSIMPSAAETYGFTTKSAYESEILAHAAEILAGDYQGSLSIDGLSTAQIPLIETTTFNKNSRIPVNGTYYHIPIASTGDMLTYTNTVLYTTDYVENWGGQEWWFADVYTESGAYTVHPNGDPSICLTVDPNSNSVYMGSYTEGDSNQYWEIEVQSGGNYLTSKSSNAAVRNKRVVVTPTNLYVSTSGTPMFFFAYGYWVPTKTIIQNDVLTYWGDTTYLDPAFKGENGTDSTGNAPALITYVSSYTDAFTFSNNMLQTCGVCWEKSATITHKVTGATVTFKVTVKPMGAAISVPWVGQAAENWCWAACAEMVGRKITPSTILTQEDAVAELFGTGFSGYLPDEGASKEAGVAATKYIAQDDTLQMSIYDSALTWEQMCYYMSIGHPVQASLGYYSSGERTGGHRVVVIYCGYDDSGTQIIEYHDPLSGPSIDTYTWEEFCTYGNRVFDGAIVYD